MEELVDRLREHHVIVVLLTRYLDTSLDLDYIGADNARIGYEATQHLIQLGHTGMVYFAGTDSSTGHDRAFGYVRSCHACRKTRAVADGPSWPVACTSARRLPQVLGQATDPGGLQR